MARPWLPNMMMMGAAGLGNGLEVVVGAETVGMLVCLGQRY